MKKFLFCLCTAFIINNAFASHCNDQEYPLRKAYPHITWKRVGGEEGYGGNEQKGMFVGYDDQEQPVYFAKFVLGGQCDQEGHEEFLKDLGKDEKEHFITIKDEIKLGSLKAQIFDFVEEQNIFDELLEFQKNQNINRYVIAIK